MSQPTSVYLYYDRADRLIYVGITSRGPIRQSQHNRDKEWWQYVHHQTVEHYDTRDEAAAREKALIQERRPPFNTQHNPGWEAIRAAYGDIVRAEDVFASAQIDPNPVAHRHPCLHKCTDDACRWAEDVFPFSSCSDPSCAVCHAAWHDLIDGMREGQVSCGGELRRLLGRLSADSDTNVGDAAHELMALARYLAEEVGARGDVDAVSEIRRHLVPTWAESMSLAWDTSEVTH